MQAKLDAIGNVVGRYEGERPGLPCLMLGSHLDTVRDAGRYDGMLGVVSAIECVDFLNAKKKRLPFAIEVIGFGDEEGVRFGTTLLGSRAVAGTFDSKILQTKDPQGNTHARPRCASSASIRRAFPRSSGKKGDVLAYAELHIEQGPVLEAEGLPVGVVTAINGFSRLRVTLSRHRGPRRHGADAPAPRRARRRRRMRARGGARRRGATRSWSARSGRIEAQPGRDQRDSGRGDVHRRRARAARRAAARVRWPRSGARSQRICQRREDRWSRSRTCRSCGVARLRALADGADGRARSPPRACACAACPRAPATTAWRCRPSPTSRMLFVRCKGGISHNPAESISAEDAGAGAKVLLRFIADFEMNDGLSARPGRLRREAAEGEMAGRRARRRSIRPQLRGRRRELGAARRQGLRGVPLRDRRRAAARGRAPHVDGVALRVRLARRRLAHPRALRAPQAAAHRVRRGDGDGAQPGGGRGDARGRPRDREPRLALDQLPVRAASTMEREHMQRAIEIHKRLTGERPLGWYTGRTSPNTRRLVVEDGGFVYDADDYNDDLPWYDTRLDEAEAAARRALHARRQRHALRHARRDSTPATSSSRT